MFQVAISTDVCTSTLHISTTNADMMVRLLKYTGMFVGSGYAYTEKSCFVRFATEVDIVEDKVFLSTGIQETNI